MHFINRHALWEPRKGEAHVGLGGRQTPVGGAAMRFRKEQAPATESETGAGGGQPGTTEGMSRFVEAAPPLSWDDFGFGEAAAPGAKFNVDFRKE